MWRRCVPAAMPRPFCLASSPASITSLHAGHVHGRGLLHEHVLARLDGRLQVQRPEMRRRGQDDVVDLRHGQQLLVGVEAGEAPFLRDFDAQLGQLRPAAGQPVLEQVGQGDHLDVLLLGLRAFGRRPRCGSRDRIDDLGGRAEGVQHRAGAAAAAADQADLDLDLGRLGRVYEGNLRQRRGLAMPSDVVFKKRRREKSVCAWFFGSVMVIWLSFKGGCRESMWHRA